MLECITNLPCTLFPKSILDEKSNFMNELALSYSHPTLFIPTDKNNKCAQKLITITLFL
jgi:hypothetical protein